MKSPFVLDTVNASIGASIGIAHAPTDASDASMLMRCADLAMYRAKATGVCFASYESDTDLLGNRLRLSEELREALEANQLLVQYQPQIDLRTEEIIGVEALLRWPHPTLGIVPPLDFLPLAEEAGLMCAVTTMVLDTALGECANWWAEGNGITVSVNVSASNLRDPRLVGLVESLLSKHGLPAEALVLEITETSVIEDFEHCQGVIRELALRGVTVSIDDFGAGFTSLAYLSGLDVRELKLDRSFVLGLTSGDVGRGPALVRAVINLGHALGLTVVAEGIEDRETLDLLSELGCDIAQGNYIGRPGRAHALAPRLVPFSAGLGEHGPAALQGASSPT